MSNTVTLAGHESTLFAKEAVRRLKRQALLSEKRRAELIKKGALTMLAGKTVHHSEPAIRNAALNILSILLRQREDGTDSDDGDQMDGHRLDVLRFKGVTSALVDEECVDGCQALWSAVVQRQRPQTRVERVELLRGLAEVHNANLEEEKEKERERERERG